MRRANGLRRRQNQVPRKHQSDGGNHILAGGAKQLSEDDNNMTRKRGKATKREYKGCREQGRKKDVEGVRLTAGLHFEYRYRRTSIASRIALAKRSIDTVRALRYRGERMSEYGGRRERESERRKVQGHRRLLRTPRARQGTPAVIVSHPPRLGLR